MSTPSRDWQEQGLGRSSEANEQAERSVTEASNESQSTALSEQKSAGSEPTASRPTEGEPRLSQLSRQHNPSLTNPSNQQTDANQSHGSHNQNPFFVSRSKQNSGASSGASATPRRVGVDISDQRHGHSMAEHQSSLLLRKQLNDLKKNPVEGFSAGLADDDDIYTWEVLIIGPPDTLYEGGFFKAHLNFPKDYPLRPPKMRFITEIWHPNIDKNGNVCISILHEPGDDKYGYEKASERWLPVHTVETILISVISMLADPNDESPANVDAAKEWRENFQDFKRKVARCVRKSQEEV